jgi:hypothetical protein
MPVLLVRSLIILFGILAVALAWRIYLRTRTASSFAPAVERMPAAKRSRSPYLLLLVVMTLLVPGVLLIQIVLIVWPDPLPSISFDDVLLLVALAVGTVFELVLLVRLERRAQRKG